MTTCPNPDHLTVPGRRGQRSYASPALLRFLASATLLVGLAAAVLAVGYAVNGVTQAAAPVPVSVYVRGLHVAAAGVHQPLQAGTGPVTLHAPGSTVAEWLAARGGGAIVGVCLGVGALLLRGLLLSIGRGEPFQRGNAARIAGIAGLTVAGALAAGIFPYVAARMVLSRLHLAGPASPLTAQLTISVVPLLLALFLLAAAEAFRRGTELARDTEGLV